MDQLTFHESLKHFCPREAEYHHIENLIENLWLYRNVASSNPDKAMSGRLREDTYASLTPHANRGDRKKQTPDEEIVEAEESEFSMANLIIQASLSNSESFPPRRPRNKGLTASSGISRHGSIPKLDSGKHKCSKKMRPRGQMSQLKTQKSMNDMELYSELQWSERQWLGLDYEEPQMSVKKLKEDEIKAQIKSWARAVVSNVRQES